MRLRPQGRFWRPVAAVKDSSTANQVGIGGGYQALQ